MSDSLIADVFFNNGSKVRQRHGFVESESEESAELYREQAAALYTLLKRTKEDELSYLFYLIGIEHYITLSKEKDIVWKEKITFDFKFCEFSSVFYSLSRQSLSVFRHPQLEEHKEQRSFCVNNDRKEQTNNDRKEYTRSAFGTKNGQGREACLEQDWESAPMLRPASKLYKPVAPGTVQTTRLNRQDEPKNELEKQLSQMDSKLVAHISAEIMELRPNSSWDDIVGLESAKKVIKETVVWPMLRPDLFTGLRAPIRGILLFGPPGTGKTLLGRCIASTCSATFFSISASSLTSKWIGEGEKLVRILFLLARTHAPSVIFIDEIDSLLSKRSDSENEGTRRIKTEFLVQLDGVRSTGETLLIVGATNRPAEIDDAARRRMPKRLYIPLPTERDRTEIIKKLTNDIAELLEEELLEIGRRTENYSGSDVYNLCKEAALGPLRDTEDLLSASTAALRKINMKDFEEALKHIRASASLEDLKGYEAWNNEFGSK